jgi:hypothetical protein
VVQQGGNVRRNVCGLIATAREDVGEGADVVALIPWLLRAGGVRGREHQADPTASMITTGVSTAAAGNRKLWSMVAEGAHMDGLVGVKNAQQFLESTTYITLPWNVYENMNQTTFIRLDKKPKRYDLAGHFLGTRRRPLAVENKAYTTVGSQPEDYTEYLANAYSITARECEDGVDTEREFMWLTTHPFAQGKWRHLRTSDEIAAALQKHPEALAGRVPDNALMGTVASRLWLIPVHDRYRELVLERKELFKIHEVLERKGY